MGNFSSSTFTYEDVEAIHTTQASKSIDDLNTPVEENTDYDFSGLGLFPMYRLTVRQTRKIDQKFFVLLLFKILVMIFPGLGSFPMYHLTMRQVRKIEQRVFVQLILLPKEPTTPT